MASGGWPAFAGGTTPDQFSQAAVSKTQIIQLVAQECDSFVLRFLSVHLPELHDLETPDATGGEQKIQWHEIFKKFVQEAELTLQNAMMLWGLTIEHKFQEEFLYAAQDSNALDGFLSMTDYKPFIARAFQFVQEKKAQGYVFDPAQSARPETPHSHAATQQRLSQIDQRLSQIEQERNELLIERRRLAGVAVEPTTAENLRDQIQRMRWREDVGLD